MERRHLEISWSSLWRILFFLALAALAFKSLTILLGLFLAIVISSGLEAMVNLLERKGLPRTLGVITIFLISAIFLIVLIYAILPLLIIDLNTALITFNKLARNSWWGQFIDLRAGSTVNQLINNLYQKFFSDESSPLGAVSGVFGSLALTVSVVISAFYLSLTRDGVERFIRAVVTKEYEHKALLIYERSRRRIGFWFRSQLLLSLVMGILVVIALWMLGVRQALLIGILAGVFELVPFIGPIIAGSVAVISALLTSPTLALYTMIVFLVLHQIESHLLIPLLIGRNVGLHPVIVIVALLIGLEVGGLLGVLISVPAAVVLQEVVEGWHDSDLEEAEA
jgi:predicted PurR-regulated permease PerM